MPGMMDTVLNLGLNDTTVAQALRYLRASEVVSAERDGRVIRYRLADGLIAALLTLDPGQDQIIT